MSIGTPTDTETPAATDTPSPTPTATPAPPSGDTPWRPHYRLPLGDHLSASVDLADGHVDVKVGGMSILGRGPALSLTHTWDSALAQAGITGTTGQGWISSPEAHISGTPTGTVAYTDSSGHVWDFVYTGDAASSAPYTAYASPAGLPWQLSAATGGYTLTNILDGATRAFDAHGRLTVDSDAWGNSNTFAYSGAAGPADETNSGGRALNYTYANGLLNDVTSPQWGQPGAPGQHVTYGYDGGELTGVTWGAGTADAQTTHFTYDPITQLLTGPPVANSPTSPARSRAAARWPARSSRSATMTLGTGPT